MRTITPSTLQCYETHLQSEEKSPNTIAKYLRDLRTFSAWLAARENPDITKETVIQYKHHLEQNYKPSSTNSMLVALNRFFRYMGWDDCAVKTLKTQPDRIYAQEKELTRADYRKLVDTAKNEGKDRLALVIETIGSTGIRVSELSCFTYEAVKDGTVTVSCKGKYRKIHLVHKLKEKLLDYCKKKNITGGHIFVTKSGNPLDRTNIWAEMKKLAKKAGVDLKKVFPHNLRHFFACTYYKVHKNISHLADVLGHSSINTTRIYTATTEETHLKMLESLELVV